MFGTRMSRLTVSFAFSVLLQWPGAAPVRAGETAGSAGLDSSPMSTQELLAGKQSYMDHCARCHGPTGKGGLKVGSEMTTDLTDEQWSHGGSDEEIIDTIKNGIAPSYAMQPWGYQLEDDEIRLIVDYIRSLGTANPGSK